MRQYFFLYSKVQSLRLFDGRALTRLFIRFHILFFLLLYFFIVWRFFSHSSACLLFFLYTTLFVIIFLIALTMWRLKTKLFSYSKRVFIHHWFGVSCGCNGNFFFVSSDFFLYRKVHFLWKWKIICTIRASLFIFL